MNHKEKCEKLRQIRLELAKELGIEEYIRKEPCTFEGECNGTCEACKLEEQNLLYAMYDLKEKGEMRIIRKIPFTLRDDGTTLGLPATRYEKPIETPELPPVSMPGVILSPNTVNEDDEDNDRIIPKEFDFKFNFTYKS